MRYVGKRFFVMTDAGQYNFGVAALPFLHFGWSRPYFQVWIGWLFWAVQAGYLRAEAREQMVRMSRELGLK